MSTGSAWANEGVKDLLEQVFLDGATPEDKEVLLFSNDFTPVATMDDSSFTEITTNGGEKVTLTRANWANQSATDPVSIRYNGATGVVFNITGALTVFGCAIRGVVSTNIYFAQNFGSKTFGNGDTFTLQPLDAIMDIIVT